MRKIKEIYSIGDGGEFINPRTGKIERGTVAAYALDNIEANKPEPTGLMVKFGDGVAVEIGAPFLGGLETQDAEKFSAIEVAVSFRTLAKNLGAHYYEREDEFLSELESNLAGEFGSEVEISVGLSYHATIETWDSDGEKVEASEEVVGRCVRRITDALDALEY